MQMLQKVMSNLVLLCGVELSFNRQVSPSSIAGWQPFYNSKHHSETNVWEKTYSTPLTIEFNEESSESNAGYSFKQKVTFRFKSADRNRSERLALFHQINYVKLKQTNGLMLVIGRNDFYQNTPPKITTKSDENITEISIESNSMFASGYVAPNTLFGLPALIPINLITG